MYALYRLMDRTLQALSFLHQLSLYWHKSNKTHLPLTHLRDMSVMDLVTAPAAHDAVKVTHPPTHPPTHQPFLSLCILPTHPPTHPPTFLSPTSATCPLWT